MDVGTLPRRVRENPDLSSPLTKRRSPQILLHFHRFLELRVPRRPRSFAKRVRKWATSKERYHTPLCGYAFSRMKSTPHHPSHALRRHGVAKSLGLLSPPQFTTTTRGAGRSMPGGTACVGKLLSGLFCLFVFWSYPGSMRFILAGATNPDELSFGLRIYPSVAVFCCCCGTMAARRPRRPRVRGGDG